MKDMSKVGYVEVDGKKFYSFNHEELAQIFVDLHNMCADLIGSERQIKTFAFDNSDTVAVSVCSSSKLSIDLVDDESENYKKAVEIIKKGY